jgi:Fe-S cluster biogenesis protein NfuA
MPQKREFQARTERIEELVRILEGAEDPKIHAVALELVQSVMELHALDKLRPNLQSQGADTELLGIEDGVIRLRIHCTSGGGCHSPSAAALKGEVEDAIDQAAPDATQVMTEEAEHPRPAQLVTLK